MIARSAMLLTLGCLLVAAAPPAPGLRLDRVVLLMRHGVRPPTKAPAMPAGIAAQPWPAWPVPPGYLTPHGAAAVRMLGAADRAAFAAAGLLAAGGCPARDAVSLLSDSDERTIATGDAWLAGLAPGCGLANRHRPQDEPDPLFAAAGEGEAPFDPARADAAVAEALGPGGVTGAEAAQRDALARLDAILCGASGAPCGVRATPSAIVPAGPHRRPKLAGALDRGSTAAQILLLEHAEGKPPGEVGWGRATGADITALSALHAAEFAILARPPYLAARNIAPIARTMLAALVDTAPGAPRLVALIGHDTNVASLGGLLDLHWRAAGYARDDPPPGGALLLALWRDAAGRRFVSASFRAQSLDQLRALAPAPPAVSETLPIAGCAAPCPLEQFRALVETRLAAAD